MAEAAVDQRPTHYCHQCTVQISPTLPDFTCPRCESGFIEEMTEDVLAPEAANSRMDAMDPSAQMAELWGQQFLDSFRLHAGQADEEDDEMLSSDSDSEAPGVTSGGPATRTRSRGGASLHHNPFVTRARIQFGGPRGNSHMMLPIDSFVHQVLAGLTGGGMLSVRGGGAIPIALNLGGLYGNPGDYAWGSGGLDAIITRLLNQLDGSGPPPAPKEQIDKLPSVNVSQALVDKAVQCSVCFEDFKLDESVKRLPCDHHYHSECIVPWLELHGTCPVCRKTLDGKDTSTDDVTLPPVQGDSNRPGTSGGSDSQSSSTSQQSSSQSRNQSSNHDCLEEYD